MTHAECESAVKATYRAYWRMIVALPLTVNFFDGPQFGTKVIYDDLPKLASLDGVLDNETVHQALSALEEHLSSNLYDQTFLLLVLSLERRFSTKLRAMKQNPEGTLGKLQKRIESHVSVPSDLVDSLDEARERRNCIVHHHGSATAKYLAAAGRAPASAFFSPAVATGVSVRPDARYLAYASDLVIRYSAALV